MRAEPVRTAILGATLIMLTAGPLCFHMEPEKLQSPDIEDTLDTTSPIILLTSPAHGQVAYPNVDILIQFNESMNTSSFSYEFISGWDPGMNWIWETTVYENDTIRGTHGDLFSSPTLYEFNVTYAEDLSGNALAPGPVPNPWNWTTIVVIVSTDPAHGETNVDTYRDIFVSFSGAVDPTSSISWTIFPDPGGWTTTWLLGDTVLMLSHFNPFENCTLITVAIYKDGSPFSSLVPNPWWFQTSCGPRVIRTDPEDGQMDVPLDYDIRVWFSEPMITGTVLFVIDPGLPVTESWSDNDTLLTISHTVPFLECQIHTVQIVAGQDKDGYDLIPGFDLVPNPWSFMTVCINPTVLSTYPPNGGTNIPLNAPIIVNFSEHMNTTSVSMDIDPDPGGWLPREWGSNDSTLWWNHSNNYTGGAVITVTILSSKDLAGLDLDPLPYVWSFVTEAAPLPPAPPTNVGAFLSGPSLRDVTVTWQLSDDDKPGGNVSRYDIYRGADFYDSSGASYALLGSVPSGVSQYVDQLAGQDAHCYYYLVCAARLGGESNCSENQAGKFTRLLSNGPNLVSIPLVQSDESIETVLQTVRFDKAWSYDSFSREWKWYMTSKGYRRDLWNVNHTMGLWMNVTENSNLIVAGVVPASTSIHLAEGWNLVGFPSFNSTYSVSDLNAAVGSTRVEGFEVLPPYYLRILGASRVLQAGHGYWVRVTSEMTWTAGP